VAGETLFASSLVKIDLTAGCEVRIDEPGIDAYELGKFIYDRIVRSEMLRFQPRRPAAVQRRNYRLLEILQDGRYTRRQVVVQQYNAGVET
jgi:hypothetical protein